MVMWALILLPPQGIPPFPHLDMLADQAEQLQSWLQSVAFAAAVEIIILFLLTLIIISSFFLMSGYMI